MHSAAPAISGSEFEENDVAMCSEVSSVSSITVHLELDVNDPESVREILGKKVGRERTEYSLNALTVGLLSLRHARGQVDADAVRREGERILGDLGTSLESYRAKITEGLGSVLKDYFDPKSGSFQHASRTSHPKRR